MGLVVGQHLYMGTGQAGADEFSDFFGMHAHGGMMPSHD
jgi:hypothetical protein